MFTSIECSGDRIPIAQWKELPEDQRTLETLCAPNGFTSAGSGWGLPPVAVLALLAVLLTILAYLEGMAVAVMLLEKVETETLEASARGKAAHRLASRNLERFLVGRQLLVTGSVFVISMLVSVDSAFTDQCHSMMGWFCHPGIQSVVLQTGLASALVVLTTGQLLPQLVVMLNPTMHYGLFGSYELIWLSLLLERIGLCESAYMMLHFSRWAFGLQSDPFGVGAEGTVYTPSNPSRSRKGGSQTGSHLGSIKEDQEQDYEVDEDEITGKGCYFGLGCVTYWAETPRWWQWIKYLIGVLVVGGSGFAVCYSIFVLGSGWAGMMHELVQLLVLIPLILVTLAFLEGTQISLLALEKAPPDVVEGRMPAARFGHKLALSGDNIRKYVCGKLALITMTNTLLASRTMGLYGLGIVVPLAQLYPQFMAAYYPMWWVGRLFSRIYMVIALAAEACGITHASHALYKVVSWLMDQGEVEHDAYSVGTGIHGEDVMVCVSNNNSSAGTSDLVALEPAFGHDDDFDADGAHPTPAKVDRESQELLQNMMDAGFMQQDLRYLLVPYDPFHVPPHQVCSNALLIVRDARDALEAGDPEAAKRILAHSVYEEYAHVWTPRDPSDDDALEMLAPDEPNLDAAQKI